MIFTGIPGIFGFLAWELKENWRLYAANRPPRLKPVVLGHHGETMRGLLRPGGFVRLSDHRASEAAGQRSGEDDAR